MSRLVCGRWVTPERSMPGTPLSLLVLELEACLTKRGQSDGATLLSW